MVTSILTQLRAITRIAVYLFVAFVVIRLWQDPSGSGHATVDFINSIGSFFAATVDKLATFIRSLGN